MLSHTDVVFDIDQLRNVCMEDSELMRELVTALIEDATKQLSALSGAVEHADATQCARLAHYVKGACANVGAVSMVALLKQIERNSAAGDFDACRTSLNNLNSEFRKFSSEAATF